MIIKAIHYVLDEKFIDMATDQFNDLANVSNRYIVYSSQPTKELKYIKYKNIEIYNTKNEIEKILCESDYDVLFLHSMILSPKTILRIKKNIKIVWISWGWDIYRDKYNFTSLAPIKLSLYKKETRKLLNNTKNPIKATLKFLYYLTPLSFLRKLRYKKAIQRVEFCSTIIPTEFDVLKKLDYFNAKKFNFFYSRGDLIEPGHETDLSKTCKGNNILLGNSADPTGNHLDLIKILGKIELKERKVIIPLSYGYSWYRDTIISNSKKMLKESASPLLTFLSNDKYRDIIKSCSHVIMGHMRQQAMGNVSLSLVMGCKLFFYKDSMTYKYLKAEGYHIFTIENDLNEEGLSTPLTKAQIMHNRKKRGSVLSKENIKSSLLKSVEELERTITKIKSNG